MLCIVSPVFRDGVLFFVNFFIIPQRLTYNKEEKLKSRKLIEHLFNKGKSLTAFPLKVLYDYTENEVRLQAGVTTSSRKFKKAVDRNRVKRVLRESYRLQKLPLQNLLQQQKLSLALFFIYTGKELPVFADVYEKMKIILQKMENVIKKTII